MKILLDQGKIGQNVVLLLDEIYLQKGIQYQGGKLVGVDSEGNLFKGVMTFMITVWNNQSIPFVIKAIPEIKIEGLWLSEQNDECIHTLHKTGLVLWQLFQTITQQMCLRLIYWLKSVHIQGNIWVLLTIRQIKIMEFIYFLTQYIYWKICEIAYSIQENLFFLNKISVNFMIA